MVKFSDSYDIDDLRTRIEVLEALYQGGGDIDLSGRIPKPSTFNTGNFATYNTSTEKLEDTGKSTSSFQAVETGKGLSTNDYTTTEKNKLAGLPSSFDTDDFMHIILPNAGNNGDVILLGPTGQPVESGKKSMGIAYNTAGQMSSGSLPATYNIDTITIQTGGIPNRIAWVYYTLGLHNDASRHRSGIWQISLQGSGDPSIIDDYSINKGTDFDGDITVSNYNNKLRFSYTQESGADNANYLALLIWTL